MFAGTHAHAYTGSTDSYSKNQSTHVRLEDFMNIKTSLNTLCYLKLKPKAVRVMLQRSRCMRFSNPFVIRIAET